MSFLFLLLSLWAAAGSASVLPARWGSEYVPFSVPWVDSIAQDPRVVAASAQGFPTYVSVRFNPLASDLAINPQYLWVRILDVDSATGIYLGDLIDKPSQMVSVAKHDNVLFKFGTIMERRPTAILVGDSYLAHPGLKTEFDKAFVQGVAANREVDYGRNTISLPDCYAKLKRAILLTDSSTSIRAAFQVRYLLGRCYSEGYQIDSALGWYQAALRIDSTNMDAAMSAMSDYSIKFEQCVLDRNIKGAMATKFVMQKMATWIRAHDTPDRKMSKMIDAIYACPDPARSKRKDPCNSMRYKR